MTLLCIDFGASRIKTALYKNSKLIDIADYQPVAPIKSDRLYFEVSPYELQKLFKKIIDEYSARHDISAILICSEMHGFALQNETGEFVSNYISWQDNRAIEIVDQQTTLDFIKQKLPDFKKHTGMSIRSGLPAINFLHIARTHALPKGTYKMISLPEIFGAHHIHTTLLAGLGIWDIYNQEIYNDLFKLYLEFGYTVFTNEPCSQIISTAKIKEMSIYTAIGDNQCALFGIQLQSNQVILNLGTGSQVAYIDILSPNSLLDQRPYFNQQNLSIITHIPSGRAINCFIGFLEECISFGGGTNNPWNLLSSLSLKDIQQASMKIDLAVFESAYQFSEGGIISGIKEKQFTIHNYISSLLRSYIEQYITIIKQYKLPTDNIVLTGGISQKLPIIKKYIEYVLSCSIHIHDCKIDESLLGLQYIANTILEIKNK